MTVGTNIALRRFGNLEIMEPAPSAEEATELIFSELSEEQIAQVKAGEDLDFALMTKDGTRLRANIYHQRNNIAATYRILRSKIPTFQELHVPDAIRKLILEPRGLILITGPTGSGKTTTLASMIDYVNQKQAKHVMTIEDPIEYVYYHAKSMIHQREVGRDVDSFAKALRSSLREDPDIILVGEMRDMRQSVRQLRLQKQDILCFPHYIQRVRHRRLNVLSMHIRHMDSHRHVRSLRMYSGVS